MSTSGSSTYTTPDDYVNYPKILEYVSPTALPVVDVELPPFSVAVKRQTGQKYEVKASWHPNPENATVNPAAPMGNGKPFELCWFVIPHSELNTDHQPDDEELKDLDPGVVIPPESIDQVFFWGLDSPNPGNNNPGDNKRFIGGEKFKLWVEISDGNEDGTRNIVFQRHVGEEVEIIADTEELLRIRNQDKHWKRFEYITKQPPHQDTLESQFAEQKKPSPDFRFDRNIEAGREKWAEMYVRKS